MGKNLTCSIARTEFITGKEHEHHNIRLRRLLDRMSPYPSSMVGSSCMRMRRTKSGGYVNRRQVLDLPELSTNYAAQIP